MHSKNIFKANRTLLISIFGLILVLQYFSVIHLTVFIGFKEIEEVNTTNLDLDDFIINIPKASEYWVESNIFIDGSATGVGAHNWTWVENQTWFGGGNGTYSNPYLIENITINGLNSGSCIEIANSNEYFIINNVTVYNSGSSGNGGIKLNYVSNGMLTNNKCYFNNGDGILLDYSDNNTVSGNMADENIKNGINIFSGNDNIIENNVATFNQDYGNSIYFGINNTLRNNNFSRNIDGGIFLIQSHTNIIFNNSANFGYYGIYLQDCDYTNISKNTINNCIADGIYTEQSSFNFIKDNIINQNNDNGINIRLGNNNTITKNEINQNIYGIALEYTTNIIMSENNMTNNGLGIFGSRSSFLSYKIDKSNLVNGKILYYYKNKTGLTDSNFSNAGQIKLINCNNSIITNHNLSSATDGIALYYSFNNTLLDNTMKDNNNNGVLIEYGDNNSIISNNISFNGIGVNLDHSLNISLINNVINNNSYGLYLTLSNNVVIKDNLLSKNSLYGIYLEQSNNNTFESNIITNHSSGIAVYVRDAVSDCKYNQFYNNSFISNVINAIDDGSNNYWNSSFVGNYWDDYGDYDNNFDGIGDFPYNISGSAGNKDFLPIWNRHSFHLLIDFPFNKTFLTSAPIISVRAMEINISFIWYNISGNPTKEFLNNNTSELFNDTLWNGLAEGEFRISFCVNSTNGQINKTNYILNKEVTAPNITINYPIGGKVFNSTAPAFNVEILDVNLDKMWYSLNNIQNISFVGNETFDQGNWTSLIDGPTFIRFYANDTSGKISVSQVIILKDSLKPEIVLHSLNEGKIFRSNPPYIDIEIIDENLDTVLFSINGGENITFTSKGKLDQKLWDEIPIGIVTILFFANDTAGNFETFLLKIIKEKETPTVDENGADLLIFIVLIAALMGIVVIIPIILSKRNKSRMKEKEFEIESLRLQKEQITEDDIILFKEKHFCLVHKGPIETYNYICPKCGSFYCMKCYEAVKDIENICWSCGNLLDPNQPKKSSVKDDTIKTEINGEYKRKEY